MGAGTAFITGATGFVGSHLAERLRRDGWHVRAIVRATSSRALLREIGCEFVEGDLSMTNVIARAVEGCDAVFHVAGETRSPNREGFEEANARGTARVVQALERAGFDGTVVHVSSLAAGGTIVQGRPRRETDTDEPISQYGMSKLGGERAFSAREHEFRTAIVRPGPIYGPRERGIMEFFRGVVRHGLALRLGNGITLQMTHVDDIVEGILRVMPHAERKPNVFYTTNQQPWAFDDCAREVARAARRRVRIIPLPMFAGILVGATTDLVGRFAGRAISPVGMDKIREMKVPAWLADSSKLKAATGWEPSIAFEDGLRSTLQWARAQGIL